MILWVTIDLQPPSVKGGWYIEETNTFHEMYRNLHAVVLTGYTGTQLHVMDPLKGNINYNIDKVFEINEALGAQAVAVHK